MSTSPDTLPADRIVSVLSHWLAGHVTTTRLREEIERVPTDALSPSQAEAVTELLVELRDPDGHPGELTMIAREAIEALCVGG